MVIGWLLSPAGKVLGGAIAVAAALGAVWLHGAAHGRASVVSRLAEDRITLLKDGREIDHEVLGADDAGLCALLGGC